MANIVVEPLPQVQIDIDGPPAVDIDIAAGMVQVNASTTDYDILVGGVQDSTTIESVQTFDINVVGVPSSVDAVTELPTINIDVIGGGGGSVEKQFRTVELPVNVVSGIGNYEIVGGKQFFILGYIATINNIWVRGYADAASRTADVSRLVTDDPDLVSGVIFEMVTENGAFMFSVPVVGYGNPTMPLAISSTNGVPIDTTITFLIY